MKMHRWVLTLILAAQTVNAETLAGSSGPAGGATNTLTAFDAAGIQTLFGPGTLPDMSRGDQRYAQRNTSRTCRAAWNNVVSRARNVQKREVSPAAVETLQQKAKAEGFNDKHVRRAIASFLANQSRIPNQRYVTFIDFNKRSNAKRMVVMDLQSLTLKSFHVAAGSGSDRNSDGWANAFSNRHGSLQSSLGCAIANGEFRDSKGRKALLFHGFEASNDEMCARGAYMHTASYAGGVPGRSWGCPAVKPGDASEIYGKIGGGGLVCTYYDGVQSADSASRPAKKKKGKGRGRRYARR